MDLYLLIIFPFLLLLSAVFSSSEIAFFSLSNFELSQIEEENQESGRLVRRLMGSQDILLNGLLLGNMVVNIAATAVATILFHRYGLSHGLNEQFIYFIDIVGMTFLLLILGEISPKVYAIGNAKKLALRMARPISVWLTVTGPLLRLLVLLSIRIKHLISRAEENRQVLEEEIKMMVDLTAEQGGLEQEEKQIIHNIFELAETTVREIMVPRTDIVGIPAEISIDDMVLVVEESGHSRFPVFRDDLDDIVGVLYIKDLLEHLYGISESPLKLEDIMHEVYYVPETKNCSDMLQEFQKRGIYMAVVVDEYGGTEGLVTVEDVMEEIIGEIQDEHDTEEPMFSQEDEDKFLVDGMINIEDLSERLNADLHGEGYETLGGFILSRYGRLPHPGEYFDEKGYRFLVTKLSRRRIWKVRITRLPWQIAEPERDERNMPNGQ